MDASAERPACADKLDLVHAYEAAVSEYSRSVSVLRSRIGVLAREEYLKIQRFTEEARVRAEEMRLALEKHIEEHGC